MDAYELTKPILSPSRHLTRTDPDGFVTKRAVVDADVLIAARRYVNQLPLGSWQGPPFDRPRWTPSEAALEIERALHRAAAAHGVAVCDDEPIEVVARRLVRCHVIVTPAADAAVALLQVLRRSDGSDDGARLADRLVGYLDHRTLLKPLRLWRQ